MAQNSEPMVWVEIEVLNLGKEINTVRYLRDKYEIMQKSLIIQGISRPYLSNLENGKVDISHEMAYRISEQFNEVFSDKGIDLRLDKEDLMSSRRLIKKLELNDELQRFEKVKNVDLEDVKMLEERYLVVESSYEYARLNNLLGNFYYNRNEKRKAMRYLEKAFDAYSSKESTSEVLSIIARLILTYVDLNELSRAKAYDDYFFDVLVNQDVEIEERLKSKLYYNSALLNKKLGNYNLALTRLDVYDAFATKRVQRHEYAEILRANIYLAQQEFNKGIELLSNLLSDTSDGLVRTYGSITKLEILVEQNSKNEFEDLVRSVGYFLKDSCSEYPKYAYFWITIMILSDKIADEKFVLDNLTYVAQLVKKSGRNSEMKSYITLLKKYTEVSQEAKKVYSNLIEAYFIV